MALLLTVATGAWAQDPDPIDLTPSADGTVWTLSTMPEYDVELEMEYYTDAEQAAMEAINDLPDAANVTTANKTAIEAARADYNALSDDQKTAFPADVLAKLTAAEAALAIAELPAANEVTTANKTAIEAARTAYDALTDDQKTAVGADALAKLEAAEAALAIVSLPAEADVTTTDKAAIEAARAAYNALTDAQKTAFPEEVLAKLEAAEAALAAVETQAAINALPAADQVTVSDKTAIEAARADYNALSASMQAAFPADVLAKLTAAEAALAIAELPAANEVTTANKTAIEAARTAYDALTDYQKTAVGADALAKLTTAEAALAAVETQAAINALPDAANVTVSDKAAIEAARAAYEALTDEQKALINAETLKVLTDAEAAYAELYGATFTEGVELTKNPDGTWTLAATPAFDVELEVEYYTELKDDETIDYSAIGSTADVWLSRTLKTGSWNTFASPVAIDADQLTALGITAVKQLGTSSFSEGVLTLNFTDATAIEAGKPYLVKVSADKEIGAFDGATVSGTPTATETTAADFIPTLGATTITGDDANDILFLGSGNKLLHPESLPANMKGFRAYFLLKGEAALARSFRMDFGDGETTGIIAIGTDRAASTDNATYTLDGRRISKATQKGVYIRKGKKVIIRSEAQGDAFQSKK